MAKKVLVVDDEKLIVKGIRFSLEQDGMEVDCAYDGNEAIEKAKESGEIRQDVDVDEAASMFWQIFFGTSFEKSFFQGLDTKKLARSLHFLYSLLKA